MAWEVKMKYLGQEETVNVDGETLGDAMENALNEFGVSDNDEGSMTLEIVGEGDE